MKKVSGFPARGLIADITTPPHGCTPHYQHHATSQPPLASTAMGHPSDTRYMNPALTIAENKVLTDSLMGKTYFQWQIQNKIAGDPPLL